MSDSVSTAVLVIFWFLLVSNPLSLHALVCIYFIWRKEHEVVSFFSYEIEYNEFYDDYDYYLGSTYEESTLIRWCKMVYDDDDRGDRDEMVLICVNSLLSTSLNRLC